MVVNMDLMSLTLAFGALAIIYGIWATYSILNASAGTKKMIEIASSIQIGAKAYLNRQYSTISIVGIIVTILLFVTLGSYVAVGFIIGAVLSGIAGYVGMNVSVRANVRTTEAAKSGLVPALDIAFKSGAITGMLLVGLGLLGVAGYYMLLKGNNIETRLLIEALVALSFLSLIHI